MDVKEAYRRLQERHREVQGKMSEFGALAGEIVQSQHHFRRVETAKCEELSRELDNLWDDYGSARRRFLRALQGE